MGNLHTVLICIQNFSEENPMTTGRAEVYPNVLIQDIFESSRVADERGNTQTLRDGIDPEEGNLLLSLICDHKLSRTLEIGCAFGISSLYICEALARLGSGCHTMLDPNQHSEFSGIGVANLKRAGFDSFELIEKPSEVALPALLAEGRTFQFALIDGWHTFDHTLLDLFYVNRLLEEGGIVTIDDLHLHGVRRAVRYMLNYPNYEVVGSTEDFHRHQQKPLRRLVDGCMQGLGSLVPERYLDEMFVKTRLNPDSSLGIKGSMIALRKTGPDPRGWDWYKPF
jgi:predicted O-methyltransferase YrrM